MHKNIFQIIFVIFFELIICQALYHDPPREIPSEISFNVDVLTELNNISYREYTLFYRIDDQLSFFQQPMMSEGNGYYKSTIPANHIVSGNIEYFIQLQMDDGQIITLPSNSPDINPFIIKIEDEDFSNQNTVENVNFLNSDITILSPLPYETILAEDLIISLSYFQLDGLDTESIEILLDDINITNRASIKTNHLIIEPPRLYNGKHSIKITMKNNFINSYILRYIIIFFESIC